MNTTTAIQDIQPGVTYTVTFANQVKRSGRYVIDGTRTETGTVQVIRDGAALAVNDTQTGRMLVMVAGGMVRNIVAVTR